MQRRTLARWLVFAALVCFGLALGAGVARAQEGTVIQGQNGSAGAEATSETASASNELTFQAGPAATSDGAPAQAAQRGDNVARFSQGAVARSGDAAAGSQVHGVVGRGGTIQSQNHSEGASATSGPVTVENIADGIVLGPQASATDAVAQVSQVGDNRLDASQIIDAASGDAVAGSQVIGVVGSADPHAIGAQNSALDPIAETGEVDVSNSMEDVTVGPLARSDGADAAVSQVGDNDAVLRQALDAKSGDSVAGAGILGIVGNGDSTVSSQTSSTDAEATSGDVLAANAMEAVAVGPSARAEDDTAQASQFGDNAADIDQSLHASSGDAVAGSQVLGLVGQEAGHVAVQNQQSSEGDVATSGTVDTEGNLVVDVLVGPSAEALGAAASASQFGSNDLRIAQAADLASGDAIAGGQVTGIVASRGDVTVANQNVSVGAEATSGDVADGALVNAVDTLTVGAAASADAAVASASQNGDNAFSADQSAGLRSGDAVAGGQVTGVVSDPSGATIQNQNHADGPVAESGLVAPGSVNEASELTVGPSAEALDETASAAQIGRNDVALDQHATLASGDAVAGSQVTGAVLSGGDATVQGQSSSVDDVALSGEVVPDQVNAVTGFSAGASAQSDAAAAQASQSGDNRVSANQSADLASGDAVAGAQVTGIVADGDATVQVSNASEASEAISGDVDPAEVNTVDTAGVGPSAFAFDEEAAASQSGSNDLAIDQAVRAASGDAVAGAQVTGVVADPSDVVVQAQATSADAEAISGEAAGGASLNTILDARVGATAGADGAVASASQSGSNDVSAGQTATAVSGDAVAGGQVTGVVASHGKVTLSVQNHADAPASESGAAAGDTAVNEIDTLTVGAQANAIDFDASSVQAGDNSAVIDQAAEAQTGDAVAGSQVSGIVSQEEMTVQAQNTSADAEALTGEATVSNLAADISAGPAAIGDTDVASASQLGQNDLDLGQTAHAQTGDAVAGAQVTGGVTDGSVLQLSNTDDGSVAESAEAEALNEATGSVGPFASALDGNADAAQLGDSSFHADQDGDAVTGDVVAGGQVSGVVGFGASGLSVGSSLVPLATSGEGRFAMGTAATA